jgi:small GTP-binding protein
MAQESSYAPKLVLLGDTGVGKTAIGHRYVWDSFTAGHAGTIGADCMQKHITLSGRSVDLAIWDTTGQEVYRALIPQYYRDASMALVVFSLTDPRTLTRACAWICDVRNVTPSAIIALAGNKADLTEERRIDVKTALDVALEHKVQYTETSALTGQGISLAFESLVEKYLDEVVAHPIVEPLLPLAPVIVLDATPTSEKSRSRCC